MNLAAVVVAIGLVGIAGFQVALALGAPLGRAAWGGRQDRLPMGLRRASAGAALVWLLAAVIVIGRGGSPLLPLPDAVYAWGAWVLVGLLAIGAVMNVASSSPWERFGWGPLAAILAVLTFGVASA